MSEVYQINQPRPPNKSLFGNRWYDDEASWKNKNNKYVPVTQAYVASVYRSTCHSENIYVSYVLVKTKLAYVIWTFRSLQLGRNAFLGTLSSRRNTHPCDNAIGVLILTMVYLYAPPPPRITRYDTIRHDQSTPDRKIVWCAVVYDKTRQKSDLVANV